jgi:hypothetical protein
MKKKMKILVLKIQAKKKAMEEEDKKKKQANEEIVNYPYLECLLCDISKQPTDLSYIKTQID